MASKTHESTGVLWESLWESLILSFLDTVGASNINGAPIAFRDVKFQDAQANTIFVQVLWAIKRGDQLPQGFEPVGLGQMTLCLFRANDNELKPQWVSDAAPHPDYATKVAFNRSAFPVFLVPGP